MDDTSSVSDRLRAALDVLTPVLDILNAPSEDAVAPAWCRQRGWAEFLLALGDGELRACEVLGVDVGLAAVAGTPRDLRQLAERVREVTALPRLRVRSVQVPPAALRGVPERKREQLGLLLGVAAPFAARARRVVDVGAGSGHFSRLCAELFQRETVALEREPLRVQAARRRTEQRAATVGALPVRFAETEVGPERLELGRSDLAVGLHACGELGDRLVLAAASAGADLLLCSCCFQKIRTSERAMLSRSGGSLRLRRAVLGLANLTAQATGVERSLDDNLRARETRLALRRLLQARGVAVAAGEEMRGVNRRRAHAGLPVLAATVLAARSLPAPTSAEVGFHAAEARREYAAVRRLSLPRHLLARLVEVTLVLDRAAALAEHGRDVFVGELCEQRVTPRNTVLIATSDARRISVIQGSLGSGHTESAIKPG